MKSNKYNIIENKCNLKIFEWLKLKIIFDREGILVIHLNEFVAIGAYKYLPQQHKIKV